MSTTVAPEGRKLLRVEARNAQTPIESKPDWLRTRAVVSDTYQEVRGLVREKSLHTVCAEANCPNIYECWNDREATFLVGGEMCTRRCDFCDIATGRPTEYDVDEPRRVAVSIKEMDLRYATVTGVARDDRPDGGAWLYAETARQVHELSPGTGVELLIPDFRGNPEALEDVFSSRPEVLGHNLETVPRIFKRIRPAFSYQGSLDVITAAAEAGLVTKSNLILGMGETRDEIEAAMAALVEARCDILTITQYLRPSKLHHPVERPHGAFLLPRRHAVGTGHGQARSPHPRSPLAARRAGHRPPGGVGPAGSPPPPRRRLLKARRGSHAADRVPGAHRPATLTARACVPAHQRRLWCARE